MGWGVLHLFCKVAPTVDAEAVVRAVKAARAEGVQVVTVALLGHKADLGVMALGPDLWRLRTLQSALCGAGLEPTGSYVSLTELSEYAQGIPEDMKQARLYPTLPPPTRPRSASTRCPSGARPITTGTRWTTRRARRS